MTISTTTAKSRYAGDGTTTNFPTGFKFVDSDHVRVLLRGGDGSETLWIEGSEYELSGAGEPGGGTVTVHTSPIDHTPATGEILVVKLAVPPRQETSLPLGGAFPSTAVEGMADLAALRDQQIGEALSRAVKFKETTALADVSFPEPSAGKPIAWNATGDGLENRARIGSWQGDWTTAKAYEALDIVRVVPGNNIYVCEVAHISTSFSSDLALNNWSLAIDVADVDQAVSEAAAAQAAAQAAQVAAEAVQSAVEAAAGNAASSASSAAASEGNAAASAAGALGNATTASAAASAAQAAGTIAETAQAAAEAAQSAAESAQSLAEAAETGAVAAKNASEALYGDLTAVEAARNEAVAAQVAAETAETNAEAAATNAASSASAATSAATNAATAASAAAASATAAAVSAAAADVAKIVWRGDWSAGPYQVSDAVAHLGGSWIATAATTEQPGEDADDWDPLVLPGVDGADGADGVNVLPQGAYGTGTNYSTNDGVTYEGSFWRSLQDGNQGNTPGSSPSFWEEMVARGSQGPAGDLSAAADGTAAEPSIAFVADLDTGFYRVGTNSLGLSAGGTLRVTFNSGSLASSVPLLAPAGSVSAPAFAFSVDSNCGFYRIGADIFAASAGGVEAMRWSEGGGAVTILAGGTLDMGGRAIINSVSGLRSSAGTADTFVAADADRYVRYTSGSAVTATVPPNASVAYAVGTKIHVHQAGAGKVTLAEGSGVTVNTPQTLALRAQHSTVTLVKVATNEWDLMGDLEAA
ncbi:MAG: hypothetical protein ACFCUT_21055 [Kiloniellaceae bacterium]